jgi:hypothetical protein
MTHKEERDAELRGAWARFLARHPVPDERPETDIEFEDDKDRIWAAYERALGLVPDDEAEPEDEI